MIVIIGGVLYFDRSLPVPCSSWLIASAAVIALVVDYSMNLEFYGLKQKHDTSGRGAGAG
jgi:hypothetical protein